MEKEFLSETPTNSVPPDECDVLVVGAGPAGSAAAFSCASLGLRTLIVEKGVFPRDKVCGGCVSPFGMRCLSRIGIEQAVRRVGSPIGSFSLASAGQSLKVRLDQTGVAIGRDVLDAMLLQHAVGAGAMAIQGCAATLVERNDRACRVSLASRVSPGTVLAKTVIVADGLAGTFLPRDGEWTSVAASDSYFGIGARLSPRTGQALCEPGVIAMRCGVAGYFGAVRLPDDSVDVAAALSPERTRRLGGPGNAMRALAIESGAEEAAEVLADVRWRGTALLTRRRQVENDRIFVVGDAAGYVEPFTGEGMSWGLAAGIEVASHVRSSIDGDYRAGAWTKAWKRLSNRRRMTCRMTALALRRPSLVSASIRMANSLPAAARLITSAIGGPWRISQLEPART